MDRDTDTWTDERCGPIHREMKTDEYTNKRRGRRYTEESAR
jgi:hypothetical protein